MAVGIQWYTIWTTKVGPHTSVGKLPVWGGGVGRLSQSGSFFPFSADPEVIVSVRV